MFLCYGSRDDVQPLEWNGTMSANQVVYEIKEKVACSAITTAYRSISVKMVQPGVSQFALDGEFISKKGLVHLACESESELPDFVLRGRLVAAGCHGPNCFAMIKSSTAEILIRKSLDQNMASIILNQFKTDPDSKVVFTSKKLVSMICTKMFRTDSDSLVEFNCPEFSADFLKIYNHGKMCAAKCQNISFHCDLFENHSELLIGEKTEMKGKTFFNNGTITGKKILLELEEISQSENGSLDSRSSILIISCKTIDNKGKMTGIVRLECGTGKSYGQMVFKKKNTEEAAMLVINESFSNDGRIDCNGLIVGGPSVSKIEFSEKSLIVTTESLKCICEKGLVKIDGIVQGESSANFELHSERLEMNGRLQSFESASLTSDRMSLTGHVGDMNKCMLTAEWLTLKGNIENIS